MAVQGVLSVTIEVPDLDVGIKFYTDAGLVAARGVNIAWVRCSEQDRDSIILRGGAARKRLHHITLRADDLDKISRNVVPKGGSLMAAPDGFENNGLWLMDPNGMMLHLVEYPSEPNPTVVAPFEVNAPGRLVRKNRPAMLPTSAYEPVKPLRLGHILVFSPDVAGSVMFFTEVLGMGLADRAQDVIAFCCAKKDSDHHVVAFAKSPGIGFHHASFQVSDPDQVGRAGRALVKKTGKGEWGFGRHTIGSNFFHYVQDPWGSWIEYYSDMDHIDDYSHWTPTNYGLEDSLANWGPELPQDFTHNYELDADELVSTGV
jgi:catechol 2,3-dioxygenase